MKLTYDFHIHTALSPCGENSMTPNNIVNMALLNGLDAIAITDHNTCQNVEAVLQVAKGTELIVIPGMEIETKEEIHILCLFEELEAAYKMQECIFQKLPDIRNKDKLFGEQLLFNSEDDIIGKEERLLTQATELSLNEVIKLVQFHKGVCIPAHIDRPSYSIISNLGMIPSNMNLPTLEISRHANYETLAKQFSNYSILQSSDSHELGFIGICNRQIEVATKSVRGIIERINANHPC
ncbi:MAG: phosphoesterase [Firmicutes bacterium HGW-Firmicutes-7]|nr:MAG: phosphoesterase [Firmicutes bacterium HGW-Firmicutes-7]